MASPPSALAEVTILRTMHFANSTLYAGLCEQHPMAIKIRTKGKTMSIIDLERLSLSDLKALSKNIDKAIVTREVKDRQEALAAVEAKAFELGYALDELMAARGKKRASAVPKYQHPEDPSITWSGRGRQPGWIKEGLAAGKTLDDFLMA